MIPVKKNQQGFTLIELVVVILVIGIVAAVAVRSLMGNLETARIEQTKSEMEQIAYAIVGNPDVYSEGARSDFGYVGDVGSFPPTISALVQNPGYATWNGPYMQNSLSVSDATTDGWNTPYVYLDTLVRSIGSGISIDKLIASSAVQILSNTVTGSVVDANQSVPGAVYADSVVIRLAFPDGAGSTTYPTVFPSPTGEFGFAGVPIGNHTLRVIYLPSPDTLDYPLAILPGKAAVAEIVLPYDLW